MKYSGLLIVPILAILLSACKSQEIQMAYFTDIDNLGPIETTSEYLVKIEPADELLITVTSENPAATAIYNLPYINPVSATNSQRMSTPDQQTYTVDSEGFITFPVFGKIHIAGMTCEGVQALLTERISKEVDNPVVTVSLQNYVVIVSGEVTRPGRINVFSNKYTILDAIAQAGDLTQYGKRDNVLLIREENGKRIHTRINLNSSEVLSSPYYYLKQNDIIYVEPNKIRQDNAEYNTFNAFRLSVISTIVSGAATVVSLIIALSR